MSPTPSEMMAALSGNGRPVHLFFSPATRLLGRIRGSTSYGSAWANIKQEMTAAWLVCFLLLSFVCSFPEVGRHHREPELSQLWCGQTGGQARQGVLCLGSHAADGMIESMGSLVAAAATTEGGDWRRVAGAGVIQPSRGLPFFLRGRL